MDREGFDACGEENRGERPARDGDDVRPGGSRRVAAPHPHRQQLRGLDAAHSELTAMATGREHKDGDGGGDCEDMTMEGGSHRSLESCPSRPAEAGSGGDDAVCLTVGDRIKQEGEQDCGNDRGMKVRDDYDNYEEEEKEEEDVVASTSSATTASGRKAGEGISCSMHIQCIVTCFTYCIYHLLRVGCHMY